MATSVNDEEYDRVKEVKKFDESKIGVKGLVDEIVGGITTWAFSLSLSLSLCVIITVAQKDTYIHR